MQKMIVFSGLDGAGKSTQIKLLMDEYQRRGIPVQYMWSRGGYTPGFNALKILARRLSGRRILPEGGPSEQRSRSFANPVVQKIWLMIAILDLSVLYTVWLRWLILGGKAVICDRYLWDTLIDFRLNFPNVQFEHWFTWKLLVAFSPKPNEAFLMLIPVEESLRRSDRKGEPFRDPETVLANRLSAYQSLIPSENWHVLDGCRSVEELSTIIREKVFAG